MDGRRRADASRSGHRTRLTGRSPGIPIMCGAAAGLLRRLRNAGRSPTATPDLISGPGERSGNPAERVAARSGVPTVTGPWGCGQWPASPRRLARPWWPCRRCRSAGPRPWSPAGADSRGLQADSRPGRWGVCRPARSRRGARSSAESAPAGGSVHAGCYRFLRLPRGSSVPARLPVASRAGVQRMTIGLARSMARWYPQRTSRRGGRCALDSRRVWRAAAVRER
jgi:hypothetical protein